MPRKSNKTAHVLNLLTTDKKESPINEEPELPVTSVEQKVSEETATPVINITSAIVNVTPPIESTPIPETPKIQIPLPEPQKLVSELIKDNLMKEYLEEEPQQPNILPSGSYQDETNHSQKKAPSVKTLEFEEFDASEPEEEIDYTYINVTEKIVKEMVPEYMDKFGVCKCNRCIADTIALSLTNLPPKYIVADKKEISPLLNFYSTKFTASVIAQITKACMTINAFPHHNINKE